MINLIPPAARRSIVKEYWVRTISVWSFIIGTAALIGGILLLPTYVMVSLQTDVYESAVSSLADTASTFDVSAAELIAANQQAESIVRAGAQPAFTEHLSTLEELAGPVAILEIQYAPVGEGAQFTLSGLAANRVDLVTFRDALNASEAYSNVDLPISNLIKDSDIVFTMRFQSGVTSE